VYIQAHIGGLQFSKKCFGNKIKNFIREEYRTVCPFYLLRYSMGCFTKHSAHNDIDLREYVDKIFICSKTISKILIILFHYYSEIKQLTTSYEIILKENNKYQLKWSFLKPPSLNEIKTYWLKNEVKDQVLSNKMFDMIGPVGKENDFFSTIRSKNTKRKPIKTRLIVLSCGHQLGFELIDYFLKKHYMKYNALLACVECKCRISVIGSYSACIYKIKSNKHCIIS
jgi:hypothetical protein